MEVVGVTVTGHGKNEGGAEALCWCGEDGDDGEMSIAENFSSSPPMPGGRAFWDVEVLDKEAIEVFDKEVVVVMVFDKAVVEVDFSEEGVWSSFLFAFPLPLPDIGKEY